MTNGSAEFSRFSRPVRAFPRLVPPDEVLHVLAHPLGLGHGEGAGGTAFESGFGDVEGIRVHHIRGAAHERLQFPADW